MRIAFMGTPEFAIPTLKALIAHRHNICVFTQPDRPFGRKQILTPPPVKALAKQYGLPVMQFDRIKSCEGVSAIRKFVPDLCITAAFGQLLSQEILDIPKHGTFNVHASLLPKYRGASPIQSAIIDGESETGVTIMLTDIGMDTGDILNSASTMIEPNENSSQLSERLSIMGASLLIATIDRLVSGTLTRTPQDSASATRCKVLTRESGRLNFSDSCKRVHDVIRGTNPWPGAYATLEDKIVKIWASKLSQMEPDNDSPIGAIVGSSKDGLFVRCADGLLELAELQLSGGKRMDGKTFLCGNPIVGKIFS